MEHLLSAPDTCYPEESDPLGARPFCLSYSLLCPQDLEQGAGTETINTCFLNDISFSQSLRVSDHVSLSLGEERGSEKGSERPPSLGLTLQLRFVPCIVPGGT